VSPKPTTLGCELINMLTSVDPEYDAPSSETYFSGMKYLDLRVATLILGVYRIFAIIYDPDRGTISFIAF